MLRRSTILATSSGVGSSGALVSAYGPALHGPLREARASLPPPEPFDLWLACRNAVAPFREHAVILGSDGFVSRAKKHFQHVNSNSDDHGSSADICIVQLTLPDENENNAVTRAAADAIQTTTSSRDENDPERFLRENLFAPFAGKLRAHGALCLTGASILDGTELSSGNSNSNNNKSFDDDWRDLRDWLAAHSTADEMMRISSFWLTDGEGVFRRTAASMGLPNTTLFTFDAEYPVTLQHVCGLARAVPAYQREILLAVQHQQQREAVVARRSRFDVDPIECFEELAKLKQQNNTAQWETLRLRVRHWMWVADRRPRSRDSISFNKKRNSNARLT